MTKQAIPIIIEAGRLLIRRAFFGTTQEIYDTKAFTITHALEIAWESSIIQYATTISICFDNLSIAKNIKKISNGSC